MNPQTFQLTVSKGPHLGKTFELAKEKVTIGRDAAVDVTFDIGEVSRSHAVITRQGGDYFLQDLGSTNGTFVNEEKITGQHRLQSGDKIMLSDAVHMIFAVQYDPGATIVSPSPYESYEPRTVSAKPVIPGPPPPPKQYAGKIPAGPVMSPAAPLDEEKKKTWLWAGIGCLAIVIFLGVIGLVIFDYLNLYCTPPFNSLFSFLYTCQ